uniref:Uncharacterized protein LOC114327981 isoform X2 n=1 Tax=Diabrotica virgifera virgifera TaxID=50390 RepID=A0A6P7FH23_DIAVI
MDNYVESEFRNFMPNSFAMQRCSTPIISQPDGVEDDFHDDCKSYSNFKQNLIGNEFKPYLRGNLILGDIIVGGHLIMPKPCRFTRYRPILTGEDAKGGVAKRQTFRPRF